MRKQLKWFSLVFLAKQIADVVRRLIPTRDELHTLRRWLQRPVGSFYNLRRLPIKIAQWLVWLLSQIANLLYGFANPVRSMFPTWADSRKLGGCFRNPASFFSCVKYWWNDLRKERRHFLVNLVLGLGIAMGLHFFHHAAVLVEIEDAALDWMLAIHKGTAPERPTIPHGWVDIDDNTYEKWKAPLFIPRDKLAQLIQFVLQSEPRMLLVDVDLAARRHSREFDQPVLDVLTKYHYRCKDKLLATDLGCPPIAFAASLRLSDSGQLEQRCSYLNNLVESSKHMFWASPLFDKDSDGVIRRWRIWEEVCRNDKLVALPSFQLLAADLLTNKEPTITKDGSCLSALLPKQHRVETCDSMVDRDKTCKVDLWSILKKQETPPPLVLSSHGGGQHVAQRIRYVVPWQAENDQGRDENPTVIPTVTTLEGQERLLLTRLRARAVTESALDLYDDDKKPKNDLKNRVVLIGGSFREGRDLHMTPLGEMPGALIVINALHSLLLPQGELTEVALPWKLLVEAVLIVLMSIFFTMWKSFNAKIASASAIIVVLLPLSVYFFGRGYWLNFALPLVAVYIHEVIAELEGNRVVKQAAAPSESSPNDSDPNA